MMDLPANSPSPRLCHIVKCTDFDGYGFNLHAERSRPGQYIGKVDENSPADVAGLKEGDRIIEVNGVNISNENHKQVVQRIKAVPDETRLLVVDSAADAWYKDHNLIVRGDQPNIVYGTSRRPSQDNPPPNHNVPDEAGDKKSRPTAPPKVHEEDSKSVGSSSCHSENSNRAQEDDSGVTCSKIVDVYPAPPLIQVDSCSGSDSLPDNGGDKAASTDNPCGESAVSESSFTHCTSVEEETPTPPPSSSSTDPILEYDNVHLQNDIKKEADLLPKTTSHSMPPLEDATTTEDRHSLSSSVSGRSDGELKPIPDNGAVEVSSETSSKVPLEVTSEDQPEIQLEAQSDVELHEDSRKSPMSITPSPPPSLNTDEGIVNSHQNLITEHSNSSQSGLNLNMTAAQMRAHLATRKKFDPRNDQIDLKKKHQIVQNM